MQNLPQNLTSHSYKVAFLPTIRSQLKIQCITFNSSKSVILPDETPYLQVAKAFLYFHSQAESDLGSVMNLQDL